MFKKNKMANDTVKKSKDYICLVDKKIGCNKDGSPKLVLVIGKTIKLNKVQADAYKHLQYIK